MIDKNKAQDINADIITAIREIEKKHNLKLTKSRSTYCESGNSFRMNLSFAPADVKQRNFEFESKRFGFDKDIVGRVFRTGHVCENSSPYLITEIRTRNRKFPIIAIQNGKNYKFTIEQIKLYLGV